VVYNRRGQTGKQHPEASQHGRTRIQLLNQPWLCTGCSIRVMYLLGRFIGLQAWAQSKVDVLVVHMEKLHAATVQEDMEGSSNAEH
jgi:hypothetical protein